MHFQPVEAYILTILEKLKYQVLVGWVGIIHLTTMAGMVEKVYLYYETGDEINKQQTAFIRIISATFIKIISATFIKIISATFINLINTLASLFTFILHLFTFTFIFKALKFTRLQSFRVLDCSTRFNSFRALKLSDFESFRALKLSRLKSFRGLKRSAKMKFQGPKDLKSGDGDFHIFFKSNPNNLKHFLNQTSLNSPYGEFQVPKTIKTGELQGPKILKVGEFQGPKTLQSGDRIYIRLLK